MNFLGEITIKVRSPKQPISLWGLSDFHLYNKGCAEDRLKETIKKIAEDKYAYAVCAGDYADLISHTDPRFNPRAISSRLSIGDLADIGKKEYEGVRDLLLPIKDKILVLCTGNHETAFEMHQIQDSRTAWLATELGVPFGGYACMFDLRFAYQKQVHCYRVFVHHGSGFALTPGGKLNKLIKAMNFVDADIVMMGHAHDQIYRKRAFLGANRSCTEAADRVQVGVITGSYLKSYPEGYTSYAEKRLYEPVVLGSTRIELVPKDRGAISVHC